MIPDLTPAEIARFYSKLHLVGCGVRWAGGDLNNHGYGRFAIYRDGKRIRILAHRLAYKLAIGDEPGEAVVRHGCDTPPCCTPDCLETGTQAANVYDAVVRDRLNTTGLLIPCSTRLAAARQRLDIGMKRCRRCRQVKSLADFSRHSGTADGRQYECKICRLDRERERRRMKREAV